MAPMNISQHIAAIRRNGELLAGAAQQAGLEAAVPSCPSWQVRDLLRHQGYVHRWAAGYVAGQYQEEQPELTEAEQLAGGPADAELLAWFRAGCDELTGTLSAADPLLKCWTFLPAPSPLAFWARRQAHETAIHGTDAVLAATAVQAADRVQAADPVQAAGPVRAASGPATFPADFAVDGLDELLLAFFGSGRQQSLPRDDDRVLTVRAADAGQDWQVRLSRAGNQITGTARGAGPQPPGCTLDGSASGLYLLLWNRADPVAAGVTVGGDAGLLQTWRDSAHLTWG